MTNTSTGNNYSLIQLHLSVLMLAGSAVMPRFMNNYSPSELIQGRSIIALIVLAALGLVLRQSFRANRRDGLWLLLLGVLMAVHWGTYYQALQIANIAMVTAVFYTFPVMTVLLEPLINWKRLHWQDCMAGLIVLVGVIIMMPEINFSAMPERDSWLSSFWAYCAENVEVQGVLLGLFTAFFFAVRNVLQRKHLQHMPGISSMFYQLIVITICFLSVAWLFNELYADKMGIEAAILTPADAVPDWHLWLLLGVLFTAGPHALYLQSLRVLSAKTAGIIACLQPLYAGVLAYLIFNQIPDWRVVIGGILIVFAAAFESWRTSK